MAAIDPQLLGILAANQKRLTQGRRLAVSTYVLIAFWMLVIVISTAGFFSWLVPAFPKKYRLQIWSVIIFILLNVVSLAGGLPFWIIAVGALLICNICLWLFYHILRCVIGDKGKHPRLKPLEGVASSSGDVASRPTEKDQGTFHRVAEKTGPYHSRQDSRKTSGGSDEEESGRRHGHHGGGHHGNHNSSKKRSSGYDNDSGSSSSGGAIKKRYAVSHDDDDDDDDYGYGDSGRYSDYSDDGAGTALPAPPALTRKTRSADGDYSIELSEFGNASDSSSSAADDGGGDARDLEGKNEYEKADILFDDRSHIPTMTSCPRPFGSRQKRVLQVSFYGICVLGLVTLAVFFGLPLSFYAVYDPVKDHGVIEGNPNALVAKSNMVMYAYSGVATKLRMNIANVWLTNACGRRFSRILNNEEKQVEILSNFIQYYDIDMSIYERPEFDQYDSVNDWFSRKIRLELRPVTNYTDIIIAPADARYVMYKNIATDFNVWLKYEKFNVDKLLGSDLGPLFAEGQIAIARLAPQDYHRFHSPVNGTITLISEQMSGPLHSVNSDGMRSGNGAIYNRRIVVIIQTVHGSLVALVAIGAVCVGSIHITVGLNDVVAPGSEIGYFQFGGSTVALLFQKNTLNLEPQWLSNSMLPIETLLTMGTPIGNLTIPT